MIYADRDAARSSLEGASIGTWSNPSSIGSLIELTQALASGTPYPILLTGITVGRLDTAVGIASDFTYQMIRLYNGPGSAVAATAVVISEFRLYAVDLVSAAGIIAHRHHQFPFPIYLPAGSRLHAANFPSTNDVHDFQFSVSWLRADRVKDFPVVGEFSATL